MNLSILKEFGLSPDAQNVGPWSATSIVHIDSMLIGPYMTGYDVFQKSF